MPTRVGVSLYTEEAIRCLDREAAWALLLETEEAIRDLPPVKRRRTIKDQSREPDLRTAFEDPHVQDRIWLQMQLSDLRERVGLGDGDPGG